MLNLLKNLHDKAEKLEGTNLLLVLLVIFVTFFAISFGANYFINKSLKNNEISELNENGDTISQDIKEYQGIVSYVDPDFYPIDNVTYVLKDQTGKTIVPLRAEDQKLEVAEGLFVTVSGREIKTGEEKKTVLLVDKVIVSNN